MWRKLPSSQFGMINTIDDVIYHRVETDLHLLPDLSNAETLIVVSDYSSQHKGAQFESYALLITALDKWQTWEQQRLAIRARTDIGKRRISYKTLNDQRKRKVLPHFLDAADILPGHLRCGTTNCDNGSLQIEDLVSIADLSAGAISEMATLHSLENTIPASSLIIQPPPQKISSKARYILGWLSRERLALKRIILLLESIPNSKKIRVKDLRLHGDLW